jgi:hypothetical protein
MDRSAVTGIFLVGLIALGLIELVVWLSHLDLPPGPYPQDSLCSRLSEARSTPFLSSIDETFKNFKPGRQPEENSGKAEGEAYARAEWETRMEVANLVKGMLTANAALEKQSPPRPLFCQDAAIRAAATDYRNPFADQYFADAGKRIHADKNTCYVKFEDDLLQYLVRTYPCAPAP